jgi:hypothetical protein
VLSEASGRLSLRTPPSMTKCATWMPCGPSSRAALWARPRKANLPMANGAERGKPFIPAVAPVSRIAPRSMRQHPPRRLLHHQERAEGIDRLALAPPSPDRARRAARARAHARIVDHDIGLAEPALDGVEKACDADRYPKRRPRRPHAPVSAANARRASRHGARPARPLRAAAASWRASEALMPEPAPTISAVR